MTPLFIENKTTKVITPVSANIMFRGKTFFRCTQCGKIFVATDIEYGATIYSCPQPCKRCGGIRTLPVLHTIFISVYEKLWENMKKKN